EGESQATKEFLHRFAPHAQDYRPGSPTWQGGKGKNLFGGLRYLADKGVNSIYFLTMNIGGDGKDVWPYTNHEERLRFDCSKLDQWERVFDYADDDLGMMLHFVTQETENELLLDGGHTERERTLYYRELIARFGHHRAVTWNLGEENGPADFSPNGQTSVQQAAMASWIKKHDPYQNYLVVHTHASQKYRDSVITPLIGNADLDGLSLQIDHISTVHETTKSWLKKSNEVSVPWIATVDETGPWWLGLDHDTKSPYNNQDSSRAFVLWGNLMAGGAGVEWYFGARNPENDLGCEDWRSRDNAWEWTKYGLDFFRNYLPFWEMENHNELVKEGHFCFAKPNEVYAIYLPFGGEATIDLTNTEGAFSLAWYNPREGGDLLEVDVETVAEKRINLGLPPVDT
ncbi:MAG: putative collagen-binding domain-containing protein, partial [Bacteroidota bacterium]